MKNTIQITLIIILSVLLFNQCEETAQFKTTLKNNELAKADTIEYYINAIGLGVAEKLTYKGTAEQLEVYLSEKTKESDQFKEAAKGWRKKYNALHIKLDFVLDSVDVLFNKPVPYNFERTFEKLTKDYALKGIANQNGLQIDFRAKAAVTSFTGIKPTALFDNQLQTEITSSTDALRVSGFDNFSFLPKPKKWSLNSSIFINTKAEIHFGVGIGYNWWSF
ncbi:hypothetical protein BA195_06855 [Tenacibaculum soleae]|uniref:Uncharacterized protein n=1 Tax=Tenacibaculum soleae TaxID=447689 RepID=A0A1B9Y3V4_9FLAO|nr:hypothetical protein [Tenacibaculum soleae]OCK44391.1 hypothetical protein BA195_06855 [Tenacibaculum soleae]